MPLDGYEVPPGGVAQVVFLVEAVEEGEWLWESLDVDYSYEGSSYSVRLTNLGLSRTADLGG